MIVAPEKPGVRETTRHVEFQMDPPAHDPLVPAAPVLFKREGKDVTIEWPLEPDHSPRFASDEIVNNIVGRSQRDVHKHPHSPRALTNLGLACLNAEKPDEAIAWFRAALQLDPNNYVAATTLAKVLVNRGRYDEAEGLYRGLATDFPNAATPLMSLAYLAMRREDFATAERIMRDVISLGTKSAVPHYQLAIVLIRSGRIHEAVRELKAAVRSEVRSPSLYQALGVAYALAGENIKSSRAFQTALTLSPALSDAVRGLASTFLRVGNADSTIELLVKYLEGKPEDLRARILLAQAYAQKGRHSSARGQFLHVFTEVEEKAGIETLQSQLANDIGVTFFNERDLEKAEHWFKRAIEFQPRGGSRVYSNLARTHIDLEQYQSALEILRRSRTLFGEQKDASLMFAYVYSTLGAYDKAISELMPLLSRGDCGVGTFASLGTYLADGMHDLSEALKVSQQAYEKFPDDLLIVNNLAYVYLMKEDIASARKLLVHHRTQPGRTVVLTATWGLLHLKEGDRERARDLYAQAAKLAALQGNKRLASEVKQKMHLELAKDLLKNGDIAYAAREVTLGLKVRKGREAYTTDLVAIKYEIERRLSDVPPRISD